MKMFMLFSLLLMMNSGFSQENEATLELQLQGDSGTSITKLNKELKRLGRDLLPQSIKITSRMSYKEIGALKEHLNNLVDAANPYEMIDTSVYGNTIHGKTSCFTGNNKKVASIYNNMVDTFLSDQFGIITVATKDLNRVGIKYTESDSGDTFAWINIPRCK